MSNPPTLAEIAHYLQAADPLVDKYYALIDELIDVAKELRSLATRAGLVSADPERPARVVHLEDSDRLLWTEGPHYRHRGCHVPTLDRDDGTTRKRPWPCGKELLQRHTYDHYDPATDLGWTDPSVDDFLGRLPGTNPFATTSGEEEAALTDGRCPRHRNESHPWIAGTILGTYAEVEALLEDTQ